MRLATVTSADPDPLLVRRDGDGIDVPAVPTDVTVAVNDRVIVTDIKRQVYIVTRLA